MTFKFTDSMFGKFNGVIVTIGKELYATFCEDDSMSNYGFYYAALDEDAKTIVDSYVKKCFETRKTIIVK